MRPRIPETVVATEFREFVTSFPKQQIKFSVRRFFYRDGEYNSTNKNLQYSRTTRALLDEIIFLNIYMLKVLFVVEH